MSRDPSPREIAKACERIQAGWPEAVRRHRLLPHNEGEAGDLHWTPPEVPSRPEGTRDVDGEN